MRRLEIFGPAIFLVGCVSQLSITGAPCPCPDDHICCDTLSVCVKSATDCPISYPPSSATPCESDVDCPNNEACYAWSVTDEELMGPSECRVMCTVDNPCADGEICEMALHDGSLMSDLVVTRMCLPVEPIPGCEDGRCDGCGDNDPGTAFCDGTAVSGCFFSLHPTCGLVCESTPVEECSPGVCVTGGETPYCDPEPGVDGLTCDMFDCSACEETYGTNGAGCEADAVVTCWSMPSFDEACEELCWQTWEDCPDGSTCVDGEGNGPVCAE